MRKIDLLPYIVGISAPPTINGDVLFQIDTSVQSIKDDAVSVVVASEQLTPKEYGISLYGTKKWKV